MNINLSTAIKYADQVCSVLNQYCSRLEVAGSIRRKRPVVHDIDLVAIPVNRAALVARCQQTCVTVANGLQNAQFRMANGLQIDIFFASNGEPDMFEPLPSNWGSVMLCRTGSLEHNIHLCQRATEMGLHWDPYHGVTRVSNFELLASETEEDIFKALDLPFINPEDREK